MSLLALLECMLGHTILNSGHTGLLKYGSFDHIFEDRCHEACRQRTYFGINAMLKFPENASIFSHEVQYSQMGETCALSLHPGYFLLMMNGLAAFPACTRKSTPLCSASDIVSLFSAAPGCCITRNGRVSLQVCSPGIAKPCNCIRSEMPSCRLQG